MKKTNLVKKIDAFVEKWSGRSGRKIDKRRCVHGYWRGTPGGDMHRSCPRWGAF